MSASTKRLWLLIKKNATVKIKQGWLGLIASLFFPIILIGIIAALRPVANPKANPQCTTQGYANPSAGVIPWLQTVICGATPFCTSNPIPSIDYGSVNSRITWFDNNTLAVPCFAAGNFEALDEYFDDEDDDRPFQTSFVDTGDSSEDDKNIKESMDNFLNLFQNDLIPTIINIKLNNGTHAVKKYLRDNQEEICNTTASMIENNYNIYWNVIETLWNGRIIYTPGDSPLANEIVNRIATDYFQPINDLYDLMNADFQEIAKAFINPQQLSSSPEATPFISFLSFCAINSTLRFIPASSSDNIGEMVHDLQEDEEFYAVLNFDNIGISDTAANMPDHMFYSIQQTIKQTPSTFEIFPNSNGPSEGISNNQNRYIKGGFAYLQDMVDHTIAKLAAENSGKTFNNIGSYLQMFPYPCYQTDDYMLAFIGIFPFIMTVAWIYPVAALTKDMVKDKETKIKDALILVGASGDLQRLSWLIMPGLFYFVTGFLLSIECWGAFYIHSSWFVVFLFCECFVFSIVGFVTFIAAISSKPTRASAIGGLAFFGTYLVYGPVSAWGDKMYLWTRILLSIFPCTAMSMGNEILSELELYGNGITLDGEYTMVWSKNIRFYPALYQVLIMLVVDGLIGFLLGWYIENLNPGESGLAQPWYFPFSKAYWHQGDQKTESPETAKPLTENLGISYDHEPNTENREAGVTLNKLTRVYKGGNIAVDKASVEFYKGQITAYLGRNGAGKTSTLQILAGMAKPTSGTAWIGDVNVIKNPGESHKLIGNCPQYNILIDELSPLDHIDFYARIRDPDKAEELIESETLELIKAVGLSSDRCNAPSAFLSGGMKRKLSIALCFVGNPKVVFLDEPTAGIDPEARRAIWKLLQEYQATKTDITMIMCTHHLDEAELLGDRVVVIDGGKIKCSGSNLWMKEQYAKGYVLTVTKSQNNDFSPKKLKEIFPKSLPLPTQNPNEYQFTIPYNEFKGPVANRVIPQISVCPSFDRENRYRNRMVTFLNTF